MIMPVSVALSNSMDERISAASSKPQPEKGAKTAGGRTYAGRGDGLMRAGRTDRCGPGGTDRCGPGERTDAGRGNRLMRAGGTD
jgi:hypothetical protein